MPLPDFLCIGAQKAGTTWLFAQLQSHPDVWMPPVKELQHFNHLFVPRHRGWTRWHIREGVSRALKFHVTREEKPNLDYVRYLAALASPEEMFTDAWYRAAFARPSAAGKRVGDITPEYSTIPDPGIRHVRALLGSPKIIYLIRDPLSRTLSQLRMNLARHAQGRIDEASWREMADQWDLTDRGDYRTYIPRWKAHFAEEDLLFLPYGRIATDPAGVMREVEAFLDLPPHTYPRMNERVHEGRRLNVPDWVQERVATRLEGQKVFLEAEFGPNFIKLL